MQFLVTAFEAIRDFMELGGDVLSLIAIVIFAMWVLIVERLVYFRTMGDHQFARTVVHNLQSDILEYPHGAIVYQLYGLRGQDFQG